MSVPIISRRAHSTSYISTGASRIYLAERNVTLIGNYNHQRSKLLNSRI
jgi:hypothetical protein